MQDSRQTALAESAVGLKPGFILPLPRPKGGAIYTAGLWNYGLKTETDAAILGGIRIDDDRCSHDELVHRSGYLLRPPTDVSDLNWLSVLVSHHRLER